MRERGALGGAGGARGELHVDRIVGVQRRLDRGQVGLGHALAVGQQPRPSRPRGRASRAAAGSAGAPPDHRHVVGLAEAAGEDEQAHAGLVQRVLELGRLVGRVDGHEDRADARGGVLGDEPLVAVGRPDAHAVAGAHAAGQQAAGGERRPRPTARGRSRGSPARAPRAPRGRRSARRRGAGPRRSSAPAGGRRAAPAESESGRVVASRSVSMSGTDAAPAPALPALSANSRRALQRNLGQRADPAVMSSRDSAGSPSSLTADARACSARPPAAAAHAAVVGLADQQAAVLRRPAPAGPRPAPRAADRPVGRRDLRAAGRGGLAGGRPAPPGWRRMSPSSTSPATAARASRARRPPRAQYGAAIRRFVARFPQVRHRTRRGTRPTTPPSRWPTIPRPSRGYYDAPARRVPGRAPIVAGDVLDSGSYRQLAASASCARARRRRGCGGCTTTATSPTARTTGVDTVLATVPGRAVDRGDRRPRRHPQRRGAPDAGRRRDRRGEGRSIARSRSPRPGPRIARMYVYQWRANAGDRFDAGLLRPDGTARPSYAALARDLAAQARAALEGDVVHPARRPAAAARRLHHDRPRLPRRVTDLDRRPSRRACAPIAPPPGTPRPASAHRRAARAAREAPRRARRARRPPSFPAQTLILTTPHQQEVTHDQGQTADGRHGDRLGARPQRRRRRWACDGSGTSPSGSTSGTYPGETTSTSASSDAAGATATTATHTRTRAGCARIAVTPAVTAGAVRGRRLAAPAPRGEVS